MALSGALMIALALVTGAGDDRLLLCRPRVTGDAVLARGDAFVEAARRTGEFLDYGVVCEDAAESARAARRAGLAHAVSASAEGRVEGSRYVLVLSDSDTEKQRAARTLDVAAGTDAVRPLRAALSELLRSLPPKPGPDPAHVAAWTVVGAGVAAIAAGVVFASGARDAADRANGAGDFAAQVRAKDEWASKRTRSAVAFGAGGAAIAAGLTWRFVF